jgi:hypothetical protein
LAYLGHRAIQQKSELSGSWKKLFFQKIWERLHGDVNWEEEAADEDDGGDLSDGHAGCSDSPVDISGDNEGEPGDQMNALIQAAAIWLTEQDGSKRGSEDSPDGRGSSSKRRRTSK